MFSDVLVAFASWFRKLPSDYGDQKGQRQIEKEVIFYLGIWQLSRSVLCAHWSENLLKLSL